MARGTAGEQWENYMFVMTGDKFEESTLETYIFGIAWNEVIASWKSFVDYTS